MNHHHSASIIINFIPIWFMCFHSPLRACMLSCLSCVHLCDSTDCSLPGSSVHDILQARNTGVGCHAPLQRIFPTQGSNLSVSPKLVGRFFTTSATWKTHPPLPLYYSEANLRESLIYASKKGKKKFHNCNTIIIPEILRKPTEVMEGF